MSDYCIENDFAAQREIAEREGDTIAKLRAKVEHLKDALECVALDRCTCNDKVTAGACSSCFASQELAKQEER